MQHENVLDSSECLSVDTGETERAEFEIDGRENAVGGSNI
jgi:hypothetical protein